MIRYDTIDLLRHLPIEAPQAGLDMSHGHGELRGCERTRERRIRVAVNKQALGAPVHQHRFNPLQHRACLCTVRSRPNVEIDVGRRQLETVKKHTGHLIVVVLACMHQNLLVMLAKLATDRRSLDELRTSTDDGHDPHRRLATLTITGVRLTKVSIQTAAESGLYPRG